MCHRQKVGSGINQYVVLSYCLQEQKTTQKKFQFTDKTEIQQLANRSFREIQYTYFSGVLFLLTQNTVTLITTIITTPADTTEAMIMCVSDIFLPSVSAPGLPPYSSAEMIGNSREQS